MKFYMAPLEGLTTYTYRNAYRDYFGDADKYFTPFIAAEGSRKMKTKEVNDILPENNEGINLVPQIISNNADNFIRFARLIEERGYKEININLGCPSGTVVSKYKGAGFLAAPDKLDEFLEKVYTSLSDMKISVKTRIGRDNPEELEGIMKIYNKYPIHELIVHPRIRLDYYKHPVRMDRFEFAYNASTNQVCYNGDVNTVSDYEKLIADYPNITSVMCGRGLIRNPALFKGLKEGRECIPDRDNLRAFHNRLLEDYKQIMPGERALLFKLKEIWLFMIDIFDENERYVKLLKKASNLSDYNIFVNKIFYECDFIDVG